MNKRLPVLPPVFARREVLALGVAAGACACAGEASVELDASRADAGAELDAGAAMDASTSADAAAEPDASQGDAATVMDASAELDAGAPDSGPFDAGDVMGPPGFVVLGPISDFPEARWANRGAAGNAYIVGRDAAGIFVYTAVCTHSGCLVPAPRGAGQRSTCPCHLSVFDDNGARISGLARGPLTHRAVAIVSAVLFVHPTMVVDASTRTPVP